MIRFKEYMVFVTLVARPETGGTNLTLGERYLAVGINNDTYRVVDNELMAFVYPRDCFSPSDLTPPAGWTLTSHPDGSYQSYDPATGGKKVIMDMFDGDSEATEEYLTRIRKLLAESV